MGRTEVCEEMDLLKGGEEAAPRTQLFVFSRLPEGVAPTSKQKEEKSCLAGKHV
jgi:hypothetical protein